jgi:chromate transport protein ChrA
MDRFQEAPWQRVLRSALVPVTTGLIIASGIVMAQAADVTWRAIAVTATAAVVMLTTPQPALASGGRAAHWAASVFCCKAPVRGHLGALVV